MSTGKAGRDMGSDMAPWVGLVEAGRGLVEADGLQWWN